ncbi:hypothetical protein N7457_003792 [Penicillium paradoxum]|uniref:uncharacterized protein n=1 Tax=Penicillium paradoxum TaxID=176176 RepID=UPI002546F78F|nr:uncharacterized protein N7457_003792 [Penicillium paradoxum]KAJ5782018.1 hypothetical protein N7457_003792 [Penicillium paradoxum]
MRTLYITNPDLESTRINGKLIRSSPILILHHDLRHSPFPVSVRQFIGHSAHCPPASPGKSARSTSAKFPCRDVCEDRTSIPAGQSDPPAAPPASTIPVPGRAELQFVSLPAEVHEVVLDYIFGKRAATNPGKFPAQNWSKALRHPRRKALSNLALVCRLWTDLVRSRIYRHIKVKGTWEELAGCVEWFNNHRHLIPLVRHVEIWIPVWGDRAVHLPPGVDAERNPVLAAASLLAPNLGHGIQYHRANKNATLEDIFEVLRRSFSAARVLTLEGGHCKNSPMVRHFRPDLLSDPIWSSRRSLPALENIQTLVMRGSWNLIRDFESWRNIVQALPALREWHCAYASPHLGAYFSMMHVLMQPLSPIQHFNLSLDGYHNSNDRFLRELYMISGNFLLVCRIVAEAAPLLESFSFTGRVCWYFFEAMKQQAARLGSQCRLRSLDIVVKGCCRKPETRPNGTQAGPELSGINHMDFVLAFEALIIKAIECLAVLPTLKDVRIRYVDLESTCPALNPYFQLINNECTGLWSPEILEALRNSRPSASFVELEDGLTVQCDENQQIVGAVMPRVRPRSIQVCMYTLIATGVNP